jgi:hypothetical protein
MTVTAKYEITHAETGQASGEVTFNEAVHALEQFAGLVVKSIGDTSPPGSPANGHAYILGSGLSGDWAAFAENDVAYYYDGWYASTPDADWEGIRAYVQDVDEDYLWTGSAWAAQQGGLTGKLPIRSVTTTDSTLATDRVILLTGTNTYDLTLVAAASFTGRILRLKKTGASGIVTVVGSIDGAADISITTQYQARNLFSDGTAWHVLGAYL